ncbi:glycerol-3-phosphate 1-O-acyltransferase PlsY, partial [Vibrio campbellii]
LCCIIVLRHHQNIRRLFEGTEPKVGEKKRA